jgi:hypothetical protein
MGKRKKRSKKKLSSRASSDAQAAQDQAGKYDWIPLWGWALIFIAPLILSEYMFYVGGRTLSMILFPIAWIGFWLAMMQRSDWSIFKRRS